MSSSASSSSSPAPSSIPEFRIPDDSILVHFTSVDPTYALDNPIYSSDCKCNVTSPISDKLMQLLHLYRDLVAINIDISINNIRQQLTSGDIQSQHFYDLLDKFFMDVPDIVALNASWLSKDSVEHIIHKQKIHDEIKSSLDALNVLLTATTPESQNQVQQYESELLHESHADIRAKSDPEIDDKSQRSNQSADAELSTLTMSNAPTTQKKKKNKRGKK